MISSKLDVRTKFFLQFFFRAGPMKEPRSERPKIRDRHVISFSSDQ